MNIGIFGSGIVGSAVGKGFASIGHKVTFYDVSKDRISTLKSEGFNATLDPAVAADNEMLFVCVPTPCTDHKIDLSYMFAAIDTIAGLLKDKKGYTVVVVKSTVPPLTCEKLLIPRILKTSGKKLGPDFGMVFTPEFLRENHAYEDFMNPDRIVIGSSDDRAGDMAGELFSHFQCPTFRTDLKTAEMIKYAANTFYSTKISFFNELQLICDTVGIDSHKVREIVQKDRYYPTHPWTHGHAYGGKCLPKDIDALIEFAQGQKVEPVLLEAVRDVNDQYLAKEGPKEENKDKSKLAL